MQLKIQRSQRMGGLVGGTVFFCLDVRADYTEIEAAHIGKYKIGKEVVYSSRAARKHLENAHAHGDAIDRSDRLRDKAAGVAMGLASIALAKMNLNISIASLGRGHHIECKDLGELMEAEEAVMQACRNTRDFLNLASTFNGSTILVDFTEKDEQVRTAMGGEVYAALPSSVGALSNVSDAEFEDVPSPRAITGLADAEQSLAWHLGRWWARFQKREDATKIMFGAAGVATAVLLLFILLKPMAALVVLVPVGIVAYLMRDVWVR